MYRVLKAKGHDAHVVVENTETKANIIIGKMTNEINHILEDKGYTSIETSTPDIPTPISGNNT